MNAIAFVYDLGILPNKRSVNEESMNKVTNEEQNFQIPDDSEMLEEYDFSQGVRGKYFQRTQINNLTSLPSIQFLTDNQGRKTAVLIFLSKHSTLWAEILEKYDNPTNFHFLINEHGEKEAVLLDFKEHGKIWEDIYDRLISELSDYETQSLNAR